jgi:hypothetical protein
MNPYILPVKCSVCGGDGMLHARDMGNMYLGGIRHSDPQVCADYLAAEKRKLEKMKKELTNDGHVHS